MGKIDLSKLKDKMSYKWRVQSVSKYKPIASCVAYIDARDVADKFDNVVGPMNWCNEYYVIDGLLMCKIGIRADNGTWVFKSDTGSESNIEKEKGHTSDCFKRAAVKWGVGRFLYSLEIKYVTTNEIKKDNNRPFPVDGNGQRIWDLTTYINGLAPSKPVQENKSTSKPIPKKEKIITTAQRKLLFLKWKNAGKTDDKLKLYIEKYGYKSTKDIQQKDFDKIFNGIEKENNPVNIDDF